MINKIQYQFRTTNLNEVSSFNLPNAFKVYIQCRTAVATSSDIYSFENSNSKTYISAKTVLELSVYDYSTFVTHTSLEAEIQTMLTNANTELKYVFVSRL